MRKLVNLSFNKADRKKLVAKFNNLKLKSKTAIKEKWEGSKAQALCKKTALRAGDARKAMALHGKEFKNNPRAYLQATRVAKAYNSGKLGNAAKKYAGISFIKSKLQARKERIAQEIAEKSEKALCEQNSKGVQVIIEGINAMKEIAAKYPRPKPAPEPAPEKFSTKVKNYVDEKYISLQCRINSFNNHTSEAINKFKAAMKGNWNSIKSNSLKENWSEFRETFKKQYSKLMKEIKRLPSTVKWKLGMGNTYDKVERINDRFKDFFASIQSIEGVELSEETKKNIAA